MNCRQFEDAVLDLARETAPDEPARLRALEHAAGCARCSALIAGQRALSGMFKLAAADDCPAAGHLEAALISAYRSRRPAASPKVPLPGLGRGRSAGYRAVAAALVVVLLGAAAILLLRLRQPEETAVAAGAAAQPQIIEVATDFYALTPEADFGGLESGQIVRVQLPRNAMQDYGLPVNFDRLDEPVTAQVLITPDGVARAIRFVRQQPAGFVPTGMSLTR